ncbi:MAG: GNAT family N-acetyltransferase [Deltaproteobacteria bacterium]|nr:GNAT family N-acetyltransferase [Deltaproteobacteria bacterium]
MPVTAETRLRAGIVNADRPALARVLASVGVFRPDELDVALEVIDAGLAPGADHYRFAVAEQAGVVVGYVVWGRTPCTDAVYDLYWIAVDKAAQGGGVGRRLLKACVDDVRARGGRLLIIETEGTVAYDDTRRFYFAVGCDEVARIPDFYRPGADKVVYRLQL